MENIRCLENSFDTGIYGSKFEVLLAEYSADLLKKNISGDTVLELGCGFGYTTKGLLEIVNSITVVDLSIKFLNRLKKQIDSNNLDSKRVDYIHSNWFDMSLNKKFSDIVLFRGIDYVDNPKELLIKLKSSMKKDGLLHLVIPNNKSIHRLVGFYAGLDNPFELTPNDHNLGHVSSYNNESLAFLLLNNGFTIEHMHGIGLKPLSNKLMNELNEDVQNAFVKMGNISLQNAAEIYLVAKCN